MSYQAGEVLEACKDRLLSGCKIIIEKIGWIKQEEKRAVCKIVQKGDLSCLVDYQCCHRKKKQVNGNTQFPET